MSLPEWHSVINNLVQEQGATSAVPNVYAFATVEDRAPRVRHVIHRGFSPSGLFLATTDRRMPKATQLDNNPAASIAWYFSVSWTQVRVVGTAFTYPGGHPPTAETPEYWEHERERLFERGIGPALKASFARPEAPGTLLKDAPPAITWPTELGREGFENPEEQAQLAFAHSNFCILALDPTMVEVLELKCTPHRRTAWTLRDGTWVKEELVP